MAKNKDVKRGIVLYIDGKEVNNNITAIKAEVRKLTKELDSMTVGSKEYQEQMKKIASLNLILRKHRQEIAGVNNEIKKGPGLIDRFNQAFNRFGSFIASSFAAITGFTLALKSFRDERNKLEKSQANLQALTGLDQKSIDWLTNQAKTLSTTMTKEGLRVQSSANDILQAFMLVGSAKPELLSNKEALAAVTEEAMRLKEAAGDISLSQAADALTLSLNQYAASASDAARYTNVLAAGSKAGAANIASQAAAIKTCGTAAASANISIEQTVALIETLAYRGIKNEVAGTGLKKFFLTLQTGAKETNPAIVGLDKAIDNLKKKNMAAADIKKMFGEEGYNVASVILQNTQMINQFKEAVTGSSIALEQAAINSDTAAAKLAQAKNKMKIAFAELGQKMDGVYTISTNLASYLVKALPVIIDWFREWGVTVVAMAAPFALYAGYLRAITIYQTTMNTLTKIATSLKILYAAAVANVSGNLTGAHRIMTLFGSSLTTNNRLLKVLTASTYLFSAAKLALTGHLKAARVAMAAFNATCTKNVYVAIAAVVVALGAAIYKLCTRTSEAEKAMNGFIASNLKAQRELDKTYRAMQMTIDGSSERVRLINEFNSKYGSYLTNLLSEKSTLQEIKAAYQEVTVAMRERMAQQIMDEKTESIMNDALEMQSEKFKEVQRVLSLYLTDGQLKQALPAITKDVDSFVERGFTAEESAASVVNTIKKVYKQLDNVNIRRALTSALEDYADVVVDTADKVKRVKDQFSPFIGPITTKKTNVLEEVVITGRRSNNTSESETEREKRIKKQIEAIEADHNAKKTHIQKLYLDGQLEDDKEYAALLVDLEIQTFNRKLSIMGLEYSEREKLQVKMLEAKIQFEKQCSEEEKKEAKERESAAKKASDKRMKELDNEYNLQVQKATMYHYTAMTSEEEFKMELQRIKEEFYEKALDDETLSEDRRLELIRSKNADEIAMAKERYEKQRQLSERYTQMAESLANDYGTKIGEMIANGELSMKNFLRETLLMAIDALERIVEITCLEITLKNIAATTPLNWIGAAKAAIQVAAIKAAFAVVKGLVSNFYTGGYTGPGDWDQPKGIVHSNEFVANRYAVANPTIRPILDLINSAQKNGTISNLTAADVAAVVPHDNYPVSAGTQPNSNISVPNMQEVATALHAMAVVVDRLNKRLDKPFAAYSVISGPNGSYKKNEEYKKLLNNKSRT